jgi:hypothetical protein
MLSSPLLLVLGSFQAPRLGTRASMWHSLLTVSRTNPFKIVSFRRISGLFLFDEQVDNFSHLAKDSPDPIHGVGAFATMTIATPVMNPSTKKKAAIAKYFFRPFHSNDSMEDITFLPVVDGNVR